MSDKHQRFPARYFAYICNYSKTDNPYAPSKLRSAGHFNKCKFLSSETYEIIISKIIDLETNNIIVHNRNSSVLVIIKLEDINSLMECSDADYPQFEYCGISIENHYKPINIANEFTDALNDKEKLQFLKSIEKYQDTFLARSSKHYRCITLAIHIKDLAYITKKADDIIFKKIQNIVNTTIINPKFNEYIGPINASFTETDIAFVFNEIMNTPYQKTHEWFNISTNHSKIFKPIHTIRDSVNKEKIGNFHSEYSTDFINCEYQLSDFSIEDFYPLRIKFKYLMNSSLNDFIKKMYETPFMNLQKYHIDLYFNANQLLAYKDVNPADYRISIIDNKFIIKLSKEFMKQFTSYRNYMHVDVINLLFYKEMHIDYNIKAIYKYYDIPQYCSFITKIEEYHDAIKTKFKSTINNGLDSKILMWDKFFRYQKVNIAWMNHIERDVRNKKLFVSTKYKYLNIAFNMTFIKFTYDGVNYVNTRFPATRDSINEKTNLYNSNFEDSNFGFQPLKEYEAENMGKYFIKGGILADDIGLGKTASTIGHIINQLEIDKTVYSNSFEVNNLIILPARLMKQWEMEFDKFVNKSTISFKIISINTLRDVKIITNDELSEYDVVLLCSSLIDNPKYYELIKSTMKTKKCTDDFLNIFNIKWNRIILDEAHEMLSIKTSSDIRLSAQLNGLIHDDGTQADDLTDNLALLKSNFRWCLTATPYVHGLRSVLGILEFLLEPDTDWFIPITSVEDVTDRNYSQIIRQIASTELSKLSSIETQIASNEIFANHEVLGNTYNKRNKLVRLLAIGGDINAKCLALITRKTLKSDVRDQIQIPDFIEKRIFIDFTRMERKIYNIISEVSDSLEVNDDTINLDNFSDQPTINMLDTNINKYLNNTNTKYLFQLCTNLLIKDYFNVIYKSKIDGIQSTDDLEKSETITLDKLQSFMASKFTNLIAKSQKDLDHLTTIHEKCSTRIVELNSLKFAMQSFFEGYNFKGLPPPSVSNLCKSVAVINIHKHKYFDRFAHLREYVITRILDHLTTIGPEFIKLLEICQEEFIEFVIGNSYKKIDECTFEELVKLEEELEEIRYITEHHNIISLYNYLSSFYEDIVNLLTLANSEAKIFLYYSCISSYLQTYNPVSYNEKIAELKSNIDGFKRQLALFSGEFIIEQTQEPCMICYDTLNKIVVPQCRHIFCEGCYRIFLERSGASKRFPCPACRQEITTQTVIRTRVKPEDETEKTPKLYTKKVVINGIELKPIWKYECINQYGSKMSVLLEYLGSILLEPENKVIIFSQYNSMLVLIGKVLDTYGIQHVNCKGSVHNVSKGVMNFKKTPSIKVIMLSSETANSGNNLTEANHVIFIDVLNHPKLTVMDIEKQAVGRTVRLGQHKGVVVTRFIMRNTIEEFTYNANKYDMATLQ